MASIMLVFRLINENYNLEYFPYVNFETKCLIWSPFRDLLTKNAHFRDFSSLENEKAIFEDF